MTAATLLSVYQSFTENTLYLAPEEAVPT